MTLLARSGFFSRWRRIPSTFSSSSSSFPRVVSSSSSFHFLPPPYSSNKDVQSPLAATAASLTHHTSVSSSRYPSYSSYPSKYIHTSTFLRQSSSSRTIKNPFRSFLRSRIAVPEGSIGNQRTGGFDLFNQDNIPEDLRLPKPGDPFYRFGAALFDGIVSGLGGLSVGYLVYLGTQSSYDIAIPTGQATALLLWILRDALGDEGNRSIGKRLFNLEITNNDGTLVNSMNHSLLLRNWYFGLIPILHYHPLITMTFEILLFFDAASFLLTPDARRVGDYMLGSRVVEERPNRNERIQDMYDINEMNQLKEEIETLAPGTLAGLRNHPVYGKTVAGPWYDGIQAKLHADTVAQLKAAKEQQHHHQSPTTAPSSSSMLSKGKEVYSVIPNNNNGKGTVSTDTNPKVSTGSLSIGGGLGGLFSEVKGF